MESELSEGSSDNPLNNEGSDEDSSFSFKEYFEQLCPFYISIGMTYHEFWDEDATIAKYYRDAWELTQRRDNERLWLQGMYFYEALLDASPAFRDLVKAGTKPHKYSEEPYPITQKQINEKKLRDERTRYERVKAQAIAWMKQEQRKGE